MLLQPRRPRGTNAILGYAQGLLAASHAAELLFQLYPDRRLVTRSIIVLPTLEASVTTAFTLVTGGSLFIATILHTLLPIMCLLAMLSFFVCKPDNSDNSPYTSQQN
ncbi:hypothetical protein QBC32DRAFT_82731 [Pseudoneurospora amorphoporcata]|uniref:Uncharacterized protein n=1 Tax=Pseudoneurospora amorphoporcata TaxID=241081 RepID=A0AAN6SHI8_9PEZI|nr:hypothetical protein QBC32DRAFT_82731 [Pseudoneurospora amorphoporcata]